MPVLLSQERYAKHARRGTSVDGCQSSPRRKNFQDPENEISLSRSIPFQRGSSGNSNPGTADLAARLRHERMQTVGLGPNPHPYEKLIQGLPQTHDYSATTKWSTETVGSQLDDAIALAANAKVSAAQTRADEAERRASALSQRNLELQVITEYFVIFCFCGFQHIENTAEDSGSDCMAPHRRS